MNELGIHHHFKFEERLLKKPGLFSEIVFEQIPFFKLYSKSRLRTLRDVIDVLSCAEMPHAYQKILKPLTKIEGNHYKDELISIKYCVYNRQGFFVRAYHLRKNNFVKVEVIIHSKTLGEGKYYNFDKALRSASSFFKRIEENLNNLDLDLHLDEYFLPEEFKKIVSAYKLELLQLKQAKNASTKEVLIKRFQEELNEFEKKSKEEARAYRKTSRSQSTLTSSFYANFSSSLSLSRSTLTKVFHADLNNPRQLSKEVCEKMLLAAKEVFSIRN